MKNFQFVGGFTLVELLIVVAIIGILMTFSIFALGGARTGARDTTRKGNLEEIRTALEMFRADCGKYPNPNPGIWPNVGQPLSGDGSPSCSSSNTYLTAMPGDPKPSQYKYVYIRPTSTNYVLCAYLEQGSTGSASGCSTQNCGVGSNITCNYQVKNP